MTKFVAPSPLFNPRTDVYVCRDCPDVHCDSCPIDWTKVAVQPVRKDAPIIDADLVQNGIAARAALLEKHQKRVHAYESLQHVNRIMEGS